MSMRRAILLVVLASSVAVAPAPADHMQPREFDTAEECIGSAPDVFHMPSCTRSGNGPWVAQYPGSRADPSGLFATFILIALLWSLAPAVISGSVASSRGQSVGLAVLLGLVLGWIGLVIVVLAFKPEVTAAARNVIDEAARRTPRAAPSPPPRDASARLEELEGLKAKGLITEDEYTFRRERILNEI